MRNGHRPRHVVAWLIAAVAGTALAGTAAAQPPQPQLSLCVPQDLPCLTNSECCSGLVCRSHVCLPSTPTCQGEGAVCTASSQCCGSRVCYNLFCRTAVGAGDACGPEVPCTSGLVCAFPQYVCRHQPPQFGEPCSAIVPCASGLACTTLTTFVCVHSPAREGEHCDATAPCGDGLFCQAGTQECVRFKTIGEGCSVVNPCMSGLVCQPCFVDGCNAPFQCFPDANQGPLTDAQCRTFYDSALSQAAKQAQVTMTYGGGTGLAGGVAASTEIGAAYGEDGRYGCYLTDCGGIDTNAAVSAFVSVGFYDSFDDVSGASFSIVETAGGEVAAYSTSQIFSYIGGPLIGTEDQLSLGASVSPVDAGVYQCHTILSTVVNPGGVPTPTPSPSACAGDCQGGGQVTISDVLTLVNIVLGNAQPSACPDGIPSGSQPDVALILQAVNNALNACSAF
jgi:hypothetical protein